MNILAGALFILIGILVIFLPSIAISFKTLSCKFRCSKSYFFPVFLGILLSIVCITIGLLLISGLFDLIFYDKIHIAAPAKLHQGKIIHIDIDR